MWPGGGGDAKAEFTCHCDDNSSCSKTPNTRQKLTATVRNASKAVVMGFEVILLHSCAYNLEQCVWNSCSQVSKKRSTSNLPLYSPLRRTTDFQQNKENGVTLGSSLLVKPSISSAYSQKKKKKLRWIKILIFRCLTQLVPTTHCWWECLEYYWFKAQ